METRLMDAPAEIAASNRDYAADETLLDGRIMHIRALHTEDREAIIEGLKRLSSESIFFRFMSIRRQLSHHEISYFTELDFITHVALVATLIVDGKETPVGGGRFIITQPDATVRHAEVAFTVDDPFHGLGIGTHLFHHLEKLAKQQNVKFFDADVHEANRKMLEVFRHLGLPMTTSRDGSVLHIELRL